MCGFGTDEDSSRLFVKCFHSLCIIKRWWRRLWCLEKKVWRRQTYRGGERAVHGINEKRKLEGCRNTDSFTASAELYRNRTLVTPSRCVLRNLQQHKAARVLMSCERSRRGCETPPSTLDRPHVSSACARVSPLSDAYGERHLSVRRGLVFLQRKSRRNFSGLTAT